MKIILLSLLSTHFLDHFLQMILGRGSPEARQVRDVLSLPTEVVTFSSCWTLGLMMTDSKAEASSLPALFSEMQVNLPASLLSTLKMVMVPVSSSTLVPGKFSLNHYSRESSDLLSR